MTVGEKKPYLFQAVPGDPLKAQQYTLPNGLRIFMSVNPNEPRIYTNIAVRAGSKQDPADTTGLAHYMEHMLFKGTSRIGALDWEKEKIYLEKISALYEQHRQADDAGQRLAIYQEIDRLSSEAAQLVAPSEYDKLVGAIGAKSTNAYTWVEQTVYVNDIPSNELDRWMQLESERFRMMALRLFHTELETVYEEFNIGQDQDTRKVNNAIRAALFPRHPYGAQTTIGSAEHLKNPSHIRIQEYFRTHYVPNNMAIVLAGDFDPDQAVALAQRYFGDYEPRPVPPFSYEPQPDIGAPIRREVAGQQAAFVDIAWRFPGAQTEAPLMLAIIQQLLYNQQAGLIDLNLNQQQRVLESHTWMWAYEDYAVFGLYGKPREGQGLQEVEQLLLGELEKLKNGEFEDWLLEAVVRDLRLHDIKSTESNQARCSALTQAFILGMDWSRIVGRFSFWESLDKEAILSFARQYLRDNYVVVYKKHGNDPDVIKVEKPSITPVALQRDALSEFGRAFLSQNVQPLQPVFADFKSGVQHRLLKPGLGFDYVHNPDNELFRLDCILEMGKFHDRLLPLALLYLPYLGTAKYSPAALQREFFRLGLSFDYKCNNDRTLLTISGLDESLEEGLQLVEHLLAEVQEDKQALKNIVSDILAKRANGKKDRSNILRNAMADYAQFGPESPFSYRLSEPELNILQAEELAGRIRRLNSFEHTLYYFGPRSEDEVFKLLQRHHHSPGQLKPPPPARIFPQLPTETDEVLFVDFPIVQADVLMISRGTPHFNLEEHFMREWYNDYFGYGLSSIVFQEIRESKALAYSTYALYTSPSQQEQAHYLRGYVGTQPDKLKDAIPALSGIIEEMPLVAGKVEQSRQSILRRIESERVRPSHLYWEAYAAARLGYHEDLRSGLYERLSAATPDDLHNFQQAFVRGRAFKYLVLGSRNHIDWGFLHSIGPVRELTLEEVFGY
ncbi:MAG: insulinase family protein [Lewinellaceae bacterium]|nr:insulinase family protein [Lewinellaceae bacterium]